LLPMVIPKLTAPSPAEFRPNQHAPQPEQWRPKTYDNTCVKQRRKGAGFTPVDCPVSDSMSKTELESHISQGLRLAEVFELECRTCGTLRVMETSKNLALGEN
jgi:hypothetical protein